MAKYGYKEGEGLVCTWWLMCSRVLKVTKALPHLYWRPKYLESEAFNVERL